MASKKKVGKPLSISTAARRRFVVIDGKKVEMMNQDELSLAGGVRLKAVLEAFRDKARITEEGAAALAIALQKATRDVLPGLPKTVDDKLSDTQRIEIVFAFFEATETSAPMTALEPAKS